MSKAKTKDALLDAGKQTFLERGYNNSGLETILQAANVPKGSFYYYFDSKEDFGLQVLDRFAECLHAEVGKHLDDATLSPLARLRRSFESILERLESNACRNGCLIGNLAQEMADQNETFRLRLDAIFEGWCDRYADCLRLAQAAGEVPSDLDPHELAEFWLNSWQGAILRAKIARSIQPLRTSLNLMFNSVLQPWPRAGKSGNESLPHP